MELYGHKSHLKHFSPSCVFLWTFSVYLKHCKRWHNRKAMKAYTTAPTYLGNSFHTSYSAWASHLYEASVHATLGQSSDHKWWGKVHIGRQAYHLLENVNNNVQWRSYICIPVWIVLCAFKLLLWVNLAWQMSHSYGFSPNGSRL